MNDKINRIFCNHKQSLLAQIVSVSVKQEESQDIKEVFTSFKPQETSENYQLFSQEKYDLKKMK